MEQGNQQKYKATEKDFECHDFGSCLCYGGCVSRGDIACVCKLCVHGLMKNLATGVRNL